MTTSKKMLVLIACFFIVFVIYGQSMKGGFVFDDRNILDHREILTGFENIGEAVMSPFWDIESGLYRPVTLVSFSTNFAVGSSPVGFHFANLILYSLSCFLIFLFINQISKNEKLGWIVAILFLIIPLHSEVVANITGRSELLALFFSLLALLEIIKDKINFWYVGLWVFLAIGSKESAIAIVPLILLMLIIRENKLNIEILKKHFLTISSVIIGAGFYFFLRFFALGPTHYLKVNTSLIIFIVMVVLAIALWRKKPIVTIAFSIIIFSFLPISNIFFPTGTIAGERLFYFPSLGFAILVSYLGWIIYRFIKSRIKIESKTLYILVSLVVLVISIFYGINSFTRQKVWLNEKSLFLSAVKCAPNSVLSRSNAGAIYYLEGDLKNAKRELEYAKNIKPIYSKGLNNLGLVYWKLGEPDKAEQMYLEAIKQDFPYLGAYENLINLYLEEKRYADAKRWLNIIFPNKKTND